MSGLLALLTGVFQAVLQNMPEIFQPIPGRGYNLSCKWTTLISSLLRHNKDSDPVMFPCFRAARRHAVHVQRRHAMWIRNGRTVKTCAVAAKANGSPATAPSVLSTSYSALAHPCTDSLSSDWRLAAV